jgi:hypothetical protein
VKLVLYKILGNKEIKVSKLPYETEYNKRKKFIKQEEFDSIIEELNNRIDGGEVHTSSWIPGSNWYGTIFEPLYHACGGDEKEAAKFFGQILYRVMMDRDEHWAYDRFERNGVPIKGLTYFRINR